MSLLADLVAHPIDPAYAEVAARRDDSRSSGGEPRRLVAPLLMTLVLALIGLLTVTAVLALRAPSPQESSAKAALLQRIRAETSVADKLQTTNDNVRISNDKAQAGLLRLQSQGELADQIQLLGIVSGFLAVRGPGLRVTVTDAPGSTVAAEGNPRAQSAADQGRVQDRDLQTVVNALWAAGAEAISINGQRLTALSAIRSAGQAILVDFRPLSPPYVVSAIGDPDGMRALFANGTGGRYLRSLSDNFKIPSEIASVKTLAMPPSSGLTLHEASTSPASPTSTEPHS